jgi:hypothetical protein
MSVRRIDKDISKAKVLRAFTRPIKAVFLWMFCMTLTLYSHGQYDYYNIVIGESSDLESEGLRDIEVFNGEFYTWGAGVTSGTKFYFFREWDELATIINENRFERPDESIWPGSGQTFFRIPTEDNFLFSHSIIDSEGTKGFLIKIDSNLDTIWTKKLDMYAPYTYVYTHTWDGDGFVLAGEHGNGPGVRGTFIAKVDPEGELLWTNVIHPPNGAYRNRDISVYGPGYLVSGASGSGFNTEGRIEYLDSIGQLQWTIQSSGPFIRRGVMRHRVKENNEVIISQSISYEDHPDASDPVWTYDMLRIFKLDQENETLILLGEYLTNNEWIRGGTVKLLETSDGMAMIGTFYKEISTGLQINSFILKLDSFYEMEWYTELFYEECLFCDNSLYDFEISPDGGYIMVGKFHDDATDPRDKSWLVKVDACGDLEWQGCEEPNGLWESEPEVLEASKLEIWPNPNSGAELNIRIPQEVTVESVVMVDARGRIIPDSKFQIHGSYSHNLKSITLNLESLSSGLYSLILTSRDGRVFSEKVVVE